MSLLGTTDAIYLMIEPQEPTPGPLSNVPFPRDPDFVDRGTLLDDIHIISSPLASRAALVGIGNVGSVTKCLRCLLIAQLLQEISTCNRILPDKISTGTFKLDKVAVADAREPTTLKD